MDVCVICACPVPTEFGMDVKGASDLLKLKSRIVVSHHVGAGIQTWILLSLQEQYVF